MIHKVSVCLPVLNGQDYLHDALNSLIAQEYPALEICISDNASTDETGRICRQYMEADPRIRYSRSPLRVDMTANFNRALGMATGDYFMWGSHDDIWHPRYVPLLAARLDAHDDAILAASFVQVMDVNGTILTTHAAFEELVDANAIRRLSKFMLQREELGKPNLIYGLVRREPLIKLGGLVPHNIVPWGNELATVFRLVIQGNISIEPQVLFYKRLVPGSLGNPSSAESRRALDSVRLWSRNLVDKDRYFLWCLHEYRLHHSRPRGRLVWFLLIVLLRIVDSTMRECLSLVRAALRRSSRVRSPACRK